jgi:hypothetical protein
MLVFDEKTNQKQTCKIAQKISLSIIIHLDYYLDSIEIIAKEMIV